MTSTEGNPGPRSRYRTWPVLASVAVILGAVAVVSTFALRPSNSAGSPAGRSPATRLTGQTWYVDWVEQGTSRLTVISRGPGSGARLTLTTHGELLGHDGVNALSGHYRATATGWCTTGGAISTVIGYDGHDPVVLGVERAMGAVFAAGASVQAELSGTTLVLKVGASRITLRQAETRPGAAPLPARTCSCAQPLLHRTGSRSLVPGSGLPS